MWERRKKGLAAVNNGDLGDECVKFILRHERIEV